MRGCGAKGTGVKSTNILTASLINYYNLLIFSIFMVWKWLLSQFFALAIKVAQLVNCATKATILSSVQSY